MSASRDTPIVRLWTTLTGLSTRRFGASVADLAQELDISEKTIRRDLQRLAESVGEHDRKTSRLDGLKALGALQPWMAGERQPSTSVEVSTGTGNKGDRA